MVLKCLASWRTGALQLVMVAFFTPYDKISWIVCGMVMLENLLNDSLTVHASKILDSTSCLRASLVHMQVMLANWQLELAAASIRGLIYQRGVIRSVSVSQETTWLNIPNIWVTDQEGQ
jgi:hypothetical protein